MFMECAMLSDIFWGITSIRCVYWKSHHFLLRFPIFSIASLMLRILWFSYQRWNTHDIKSTKHIVQIQNKMRIFYIFWLNFSLGILLTERTNKIFMFYAKVHDLLKKSLLYQDRNPISCSVIHKTSMMHTMTGSVGKFPKSGRLRTATIKLIAQCCKNYQNMITNI